MRHRYVVVEIAESYLGTPYVWGGDDPTGFDCSGLAIECYKSVGVLPRSGDWTADRLMMIFPQIGLNQLQRGDAVFWITDTDNPKAIHVGIALGGGLYIGAEGGGSWATDPGQALKRDAFIKIRPINSRGQPSDRIYAAPQFKDEQ